MEGRILLKYVCFGKGFLGKIVSLKRKISFFSVLADACQQSGGVPSGVVLHCVSQDHSI